MVLAGASSCLTGWPFWCRLASMVEVSRQRSVGVVLIGTHKGLRCCFTFSMYGQRHFPRTCCPEARYTINMMCCQVLRIWVAQLRWAKLQISFMKLTGPLAHGRVSSSLLFHFLLLSSMFHVSCFLNLVSLRTHSKLNLNSLHATSTSLRVHSSCTSMSARSHFASPGCRFDFLGISLWFHFVRLHFNFRLASCRY